MSKYRGSDPNGNMTLRSVSISAAVTLVPERTGLIYAHEGTPDVWQFAYDGFNRLTRVQNGGNISTYAYGGDGMRISKTVNGVETRHIWDGAHIVAETRGDGNVFARYFRGLGGELIFGHTNHDHFFYTFDGMGNVVGLFDNSSSLTPIADYRFDAFGNQLGADGTWLSNSPNGSASAVHNPFRYRGHGYFDGHSGLHYLRNRFYDPGIGRFINEDPIRCGTNWYIYAFNNPIMWDDPTGLSPLIPLRSTVEGTRGIDGNFGTVEWNYVTNDRVTVNLDGESIVIFANDDHVSFRNGNMYINSAYLWAALGAIDLGRGWSARKDIGTGEPGRKTHMHVRGPRGQHWSQNDDGSPHDQHRNSSGSPPGRVLDELNRREGWDWRAKAREHDRQNREMLNQAIQDWFTGSPAYVPGANPVIVPAPVPAPVPTIPKIIFGF